MSENGEIYSAGKNFTLPPALTAWTNSTSDCNPHPQCLNTLRGGHISDISSEMWLFYTLFLLRSTFIHAFPAFTFTGSYDSAAAPSFVSLKSDIDLPSFFILCSSKKLARFDDSGFFSLYGKDSGFWSTIEFKTYSKAVKLAFSWGGKYYIMRELSDPKIDFWYHICQKFDFLKKNVEIAVNGKILGRILNDSVTNIPAKLRMDLGIGYRGQQFHGAVANVRLFNEGNIRKISAAPCEQRNKTILAWNPKDWKIVGSDWSLQEEFNETICIPNEHYNLAISTKMKIDVAMDICRKMLNKSTIPFQLDREALSKYVGWHKTTTNNSCSSIWTPFSDQNTEGTFLNMNDNTTVTIHQGLWDATEPNGGKDENFARISVSRSVLYDVSIRTLGCSSCQISHNLLLRLDGLCPGSLMGNIPKLFYYTL